jgi:adenosylcobinamide-phosphate synthase
MNDIAAVLILAVLLDRLFGEPPERLHSTVWMGKAVDVLRSHAFGNKTCYGFLILLAVTLPFSGAAYILMKILQGHLAGLLAAAAALKLQFSWRALRDHAMSVVDSLEGKNIEEARGMVSLIVGRDPTNLGEEHIISATVESIGESSVDGIISPLFYFLLVSPLGIPLAVSAAVFYRAVNTLDSMIGYKGQEMGAFSARMDDLLNYIPARMAALFVIVSSFLLRKDWKNSYRVFLRDRRNTPSPNSGQTMAAVAGALGVRLEKLGFYTLGDKNERLRCGHIPQALRIVDLTVLISIAFIYGVMVYVVAP